MSEAAHGQLSERGVGTVAQPDTPSPITIQERRRAIRSLLVPHDPADARTAYYALEHAPHRTALTLHRAQSGHVDGFLAACITGGNPFQPLVVLRAFGRHTLEELIYEALTPGRSYLFSVPVYVGMSLEEISRTQGELLTVSDVIIWRILRTDASRFLPLINVLVTQERAADGSPRWQIRGRERVVAAAGVNWRGGHWAEVYVASESPARARHWDESVLAVATSALLRDGTMPLYPVAEEDSQARQTAEARGYHDSGARELTCVVTVRRAEAAEHRMT
jgi:hypothetical protein